MKFTTKRIADGISLSVMPSDKFKAGVIAFSLTLPLSKEAVAHGLILSGLLRRGTEKYPSIFIFSKVYKRKSARKYLTYAK